MAIPNEPNQRRPQPEDGSDKDLNLTNSDASLQNIGNPQQPDATSMNDGAASVASENLTQSVMGHGEVNPEYGDAADPTFESM
jgi:hypothetical protein